MKYTYLLASLMFLASCGTESTTKETTAEQETTSEVVEENTKTDKLLGTWEFEDTSLNITQVITYQEDGTYQMKMGSMDINGTWKLTDDVLITKSRPDSDGQKKTIIKLTQDSLCTFWEPKRGTGRNMNYSRSK